ncbi:MULTISPECIES: PfkB family carbohydrate kinase [unclassified Apibacter]|uniref:PfkB family carbohydrate kinase n=1 Tax=unclassified Apibacter TaxID=2630820 RepID=UPI0013208578|nr:MULTISPECIES: PfkB family carbohydrate kinase [unclassified Apibacter]MCX8676963.1 bifunctional hydroxymethylpyrimidine kinase/phosphomethylpyrimidine kinase [Apibacter sp. B3919]MXO24655.1 sugar kinase [Apibacter sp. B3924]MXO25899.1 sugar kinase [Apibacter sp. B3813]MXO27850.1 sugar kinase [Apibacter sp. B3913]MXO29790.1 sugar kinase [Apibacter sp. B3912]
MKLLAVGTVAYDAIETPFGKTDKILGGAATYIGLAASKLGAEVNLVSVIGGDFKPEYIEVFHKNSIGIEGVKKIEDGKTFFWSGKYHIDMNNRDTLITELNVLENFEPKIPDSQKNSEIVMLGNLHPAIQLSVLEQMTDKPKLVILDTMDFWMNTAWDSLLQIISKVDVLTVNDAEARQLSGEYSLVKAAKKIQSMGPKVVIIKKGEHGALLFNENKIFFAPALPLEDVFDPTGAGDTFAGGFAGYITQTADLSYENMKKAIIVGSALASFTVEKFGTEKLQELSSLEYENRLNEFKNLTEYNYSF